MRKRLRKRMLLQRKNPKQKLPGVNQDVLKVKALARIPPRRNVRLDLLDKQRKPTQIGSKTTSLPNQPEKLMQKRVNNNLKNLQNKTIDQIEGKSKAPKNKLMVGKTDEVVVTEVVAIANQTMSSTG